MKLYALIMAGGEGKRFWPLSSKQNPKQFLSLTGQKSLIRQTVDRILPLIPINNIFIVTVGEYEGLTLRHIPELPKQNVLIEPQGKNTAPCIAYGTLVIESMCEDAVTVVLPADHAISDEGEFLDTLKFGATLAEKKLDSGKYPLITLGVTPTMPETGYGYIKSTGNLMHSDGVNNAYIVESFTEKPDFETAHRFLSEGGYYWNSGIFIWKTKAIISAFDSILSEWSPYLENITENVSSPGALDAVSGFYNKISPGSIDKLILEHADNTVVLPVTFQWSDVGSWKALDEYLRASGTTAENIIIGDGVAVNSSKCLVIGGAKTVALVGVKNVVVVESENAILVLNKESSQDVKEVVEKLNTSGKFT